MSNLSSTSVRYLKGVGPAKLKLFEQLGISSVEDLMYFFPRRHEDRRKLTSIAQVELGKWQTVCGKVVAPKSRRSWYTKKHVSEITLDDGTGKLNCIWFNQPYLEKYFKDGAQVVCYGKVDAYKNKLQMIVPEYELINNEEDEQLSLRRIVPIYSLTKGITQRYLRRVIKTCLDKYHQDLTDELPVKLRNKHRLANIRRSILNIHFPDNPEDQSQAMRRVSFEEFFFFQISVLLRRMSITQKQGKRHTVDQKLCQAFEDGLPFELTGAQKKVMKDISTDMAKETPMLRLLQGDVGCGKTLMALFGCMAACANKHQACIMAPTEILARQHFATVTKLIKDGPLKGIKVVLLVNELKQAEKTKLMKGIKAGLVDLVIGTHALISENVTFKDLSFVVIDEQHKFGVRQRALLTEKGNNPDVLIMTATPIPRTLYFTLYGDLDVSVIDEMPKGRGSIKTQLFNEEKAKEAYAFVCDQVKKGRQAYVVYPIIEESKTTDLKSAQEMFKHFQKHEFKDFRIGLVHGQMKREQTEKAMNEFKSGKIDILVATTVLEVGIDVPNATVMVIEHAQRFGLSQLHQLRGRIGRGVHDSYCLLIGEATTEEGDVRLKAMVEHSDGFAIAEQDLLIRGPGRFFGRHQHGLNELKVANPVTQLDILELARKEAGELVSVDPELKSEVNRRIKEVIQSRYPTYLSMVAAG